MDYREKLDALSIDPNILKHLILEPEFSEKLEKLTEGTDATYKTSLKKSIYSLAQRSNNTKYSLQLYQFNWKYLQDLHSLLEIYSIYANRSVPVDISHKIEICCSCATFILENRLASPTISLLQFNRFINVFSKLPTNLIQAICLLVLAQDPENAFLPRWMTWLKNQCSGASDTTEDIFKNIEILDAELFFELAQDYLASKNHLLNINTFRNQLKMNTSMPEIITALLDPHNYLNQKRDFTPETIRKRYQRYRKSDPTLISTNHPEGFFAFALQCFDGASFPTETPYYQNTPSQIKILFVQLLKMLDRLPNAKEHYQQLRDYTYYYLVKCHLKYFDALYIRDLKIALEGCRDAFPDFYSLTKAQLFMEKKLPAYDPTHRRLLAAVYFAKALSCPSKEIYSVHDEKFMAKLLGYSRWIYSAHYTNISLVQKALVHNILYLAYVLDSRQLVKNFTTLPRDSSHRFFLSPKPDGASLVASSKEQIISIGHGDVVIGYENELLCYTRLDGGIYPFHFVIDPRHGNNLLKLAIENFDVFTKFLSLALHEKIISHDQYNRSMSSAIKYKILDLIEKPKALVAFIPCLLKEKTYVTEDLIREIIDEIFPLTPEYNAAFIVLLQNLSIHEIITNEQYYKFRIIHSITQGEDINDITNFILDHYQEITPVLIHDIIDSFSAETQKYYVYYIMANVMINNDERENAEKLLNLLPIAFAVDYSMDGVVTSLPSTSAIYAANYYRMLLGFTGPDKAMEDVKLAEEEKDVYCNHWKASGNTSSINKSSMFAIKRIGTLPIEFSDVEPGVAALYRTAAVA